MIFNSFTVANDYNFRAEFPNFVTFFLYFENSLLDYL